jgi:hypothetical protein
MLIRFENYRLFVYNPNNFNNVIWKIFHPRNLVILFHTQFTKYSYLSPIICHAVNFLMPAEYIQCRPKSREVKVFYG